jgi:HSP20 family protein
MIYKYKESETMATIVVRPFGMLPVVRAVAAPSVNFSASESAEGYTIKAVIPGINPNDLEIELANQTLTIKGEGFSRSFRFRLPLNPDAVQTSYDYGVLTITLPKADSLKPRRITVQAAPALVAEQPAEQPVEQAA